MKKNVYVVELNHFAVQQKITQLCKSSLLQENLKENLNDLGLFGDQCFSV